MTICSVRWISRKHWLSQPHCRACRAALVLVGERVIFYVADVEALYDRALAADTSPLPCPAMPNGVSASST
jgi:hypothetical protein